MLLLINTTFCLISNSIFSPSCKNAKSYLMALWESIPIKRFTLTSNLELNWCTTVLTLFLMSINKPLKRNLTTLSSLVSLNHAGRLNGHPQPLLSLKWMVAFDKLQTYAHSTKQSFAKNILYLSSQICQTQHFHAKLHFWTWWIKPRALCHCHVFWLIQIQKSSYGTQLCPQFCPESHEEVLCNVKDTGVYLDNISAFSFTWEHHILLLDIILHQLEANGFTVNLLKCEWAIQETDWLGYWLTPTV